MYRRITIVAAILLAIIIVTGAAVRLDQLGPRLPGRCELPEEPAPGARAVERARHHRARQSPLHGAGVGGGDPGRARQPGARPEAARPDLVVVGLVVGVLAEAILGQLTVAFDLKPPFVMAHFLLSILAPQRRAGARATRRATRRARSRGGHAPDGRARPGARRARGGRAVHRHRRHRQRAAQWRRSPRQRRARLDLSLADAARFHSSWVWLFLATTLVMLWIIRRDGAPHSVAAARHPPVGRPRRSGRRRLRAVLQRHAPRSWSASMSRAPPRSGARRSSSTWASSTAPQRVGSDPPEPDASNPVLASL